MADAHAKNHDYHLVDPSPWPFVGSISAFVLAVGAVTWMHGSNPAVMILGFLGCSLRPVFHAAAAPASTTADHPGQASGCHRQTHDTPAHTLST